MEDVSNYNKIREDVQKFYGNTRPILCPALNEQVHFTAEGFNHIIFKGSRSERERPSQIMRFKLFSRALKLISLSKYRDIKLISTMKGNPDED